MDVADACCQEVNAQISDLLALVGICALAHTNYAVFLAANGTNLSLDGNALLVSSLNQLGCLSHVLFDRVVRTVEHDRREACFQTLVAVVIRAVIQMQSNGNGDVHFFHHAVYHAYNGLVAGHVLTSALGYAQNNGGV